MRSGYQNKADAMQELANKMAGKYGGHVPDVIYSRSAEDKDKGQRRLFAAGGAAKVRHKVATAEGAPKNYPRRSYTKSTCGN